MDSFKKFMEAKMDGIEGNMEANMDGLKKGVEAKMDGLKDGMEAKMDGIEGNMEAKMDDLKKSVEANMDGLKNGIEGNMEYLQKYMEKNVVEEIHDENKRNVNHDFIDSNVGFKTHHIPNINMRQFDGKGLVTWILQMEQYFDIHNLQNTKKVRIATLYLEPNQYLWC